MHQTIYGETHKVNILERKVVDDFLSDSIEEIKKPIDSCIYKSKKLISDKVLNYLNIEKPDKSYQQLKYLLRKEYDDCEKIYPYLGDMFVLLYFNNALLETINENIKLFKFNRKKQSIFLNTIKDINAQNIARWYFDNCSMEREVFIEKYDGKDIIVEKNNKLNFNIDFDTDYIGSSKNYEMKKYRYIVIDGFIESIGEIHHLLHFANKSKEPYVIFCYGLSQEVKNVIIENNSKGRTEIMPISITFDEKSLNILNDIALIHNCDVVSCLKGQTISQEIRKELPIGKYIKINKDKSIEIEPVVSDIILNCHKNYLRKNIENSMADVDTSYIESRIKNLSIKSLKIYVPSMLLANVDFVRSIDYFFRYLKTIQNPTAIVNIENSQYFVPAAHFHNLVEKINNMKKTYNNISKVIIRS